MFTKVLLVCAVAAIAAAIEYPAGIHPAVCPNYPYCDAEVLARHTPQGIPIPDWEMPFAYARMVSAPISVAAAPARGRIIAPARAAEYPADVDPATCPNYPYCA